MRKSLFLLCLVAAVGVGAWRFLAPAPTPKNPMERLKAVSPVEKLREPKASAPVVRSAPPAPPSAEKMSPKRAQLEERFTDLREEGRRIRETLIANDPKAAQAYANMSRRPEYREILDRRHQIEAAWEKAPDNEREGMLNEMNSLRQQGVGMLLAEIQSMNSQPETGTTLQRTSPGTLTLTPGSGSAPAPAPAPPVVFQ